MTAATSQAAWDKLRRERDELAAQIGIMRGLLLAGRPMYGAVGSRDDEVTALQKAFDEVLNMPNTAADILRQRDARTLWETVERLMSLERDTDSFNNSIRTAITEVQDMVYELERKNG